MGNGFAARHLDYIEVPFESHRGHAPFALNHWMKAMVMALSFPMFSVPYVARGGRRRKLYVDCAVKIINRSVCASSHPDVFSGLSRTQEDLLIR